MGSRLRLRMLGVGLVVGLGVLVLPSLAWAGGTWMYASSDHTQLQINFQTDDGSTAQYEVFTLSVAVVSATCPGDDTSASVGQPDNNPDQFECHISPAASSGTVSVTTDPEPCGAQIANEASFNGTPPYIAQNSIMPVAGNCPSPPPVAAFTVSSNPTAGSPVSFDGSGSTDPNSGGAITAYSWDFGDGSPAGSGAMVSHTYAHAGSYTVMLTVTDKEGGTGSVTHKVTVAAAPAGMKPVNTGLPQISGDAFTGNKLTASTGTWTNNPTSFAYQWQRCRMNGGGCRNIEGATQSFWGPTKDDINFTLDVVVTATNASGSTSATSQTTAVVEPGPLTVGSPSTNGPAVTLPVGCSAQGVGAFNGNCLLLLVLAALGGGQPSTGHAPDLAIAASCHHRKHCPKPLVVGKTKVKIRAGHIKDVRITLDRAGRRLLAKDRRLKVKLTIKEAGHILYTRTIVFKAKPSRKHR